MLHGPELLCWLVRCIPTTCLLRRLAAMLAYSASNVASLSSIRVRWPAHRWHHRWNTTVTTVAAWSARGVGWRISILSSRLMRCMRWVLWNGSSRPQPHCHVSDPLPCTDACWHYVTVETLCDSLFWVTDGTVTCGIKHFLHRRSIHIIQSSVSAITASAASRTFSLSRTCDIFWGTTENKLLCYADLMYGYSLNPVGFSFLLKFPPPTRRFSVDNLLTAGVV